MEIELRKIDPANKDAVVLLEVLDSQKQYIASNDKSLKTAAEEKYKNISRPFAIYADDNLVGFTMFAFDFENSEPEYWLWRFMIDNNFQGKGYGSAALERIIEYFRGNGANHIFLSTKETNTSALKLYHKYGFAETGEMNDGEVVLQLIL